MAANHPVRFQDRRDKNAFRIQDLPSASAVIAPLQPPFLGQPAHQRLELHRPRLLAVEDRLDEIRREQRQPQVCETNDLSSFSAAASSLIVAN